LSSNNTQASLNCKDKLKKEDQKASICKIDSRDNHKKILVLDIDETLVTPSDFQISDYDAIIKVI